MLNDNDVDAALKASALTLPNFENLNDEFLNDSNPDAICRARKALKIFLADTLKEEFLKTFNDAKNICGEKYKFIPEHVAERRLANMCLSYLIETKESRF